MIREILYTFAVLVLVALLATWFMDFFNLEHWWTVYGIDIPLIPLIAVLLLFNGVRVKKKVPRRKRELGRLEDTFPDLSYRKVSEYSTNFSKKRYTVSIDIVNKPVRGIGWDDSWEKAEKKAENMVMEDLLELLEKEKKEKKEEAKIEELKAKIQWE